MEPIGYFGLGAFWFLAAWSMVGRFREERVGHGKATQARVFAYVFILAGIGFFIGGAVVGIYRLISS